MRNSPMNPFSPGRPSEENMATLMHQAAEIVDAAETATLLEQSDEVEQRGRGNAVVEDLHENAAQSRLHVDQR